MFTHTDFRVGSISLSAYYVPCTAEDWKAVDREIQFSLRAVSSVVESRSFNYGLTPTYVVL